MMDKIRSKAVSLGATDFGKSKVKNKKYYVIYKGKRINFGHTSYEDFTMHRNDERRRRYLARAKKIIDKQGSFTYKDKTKANHWSYWLLWN